MVKCILEGKVINLGGIEEEAFEEDLIIEYDVDGKVLCVMDASSPLSPPEPIPEEEIEEFGNKNTKVVEDCFDENGRPQLKIVYLHTDWSYIEDTTIVGSEWLQRFLDAQRDGTDEYCFDTGNNVDPPRVIIVKQNKDYWPGSELQDPFVFERRAAKANEFIKIGRKMFKPDHKKVYPIHYFGDDGSRTNDFGKDRSRHRYENYTNPSLPGYAFLMANKSKSALLRWKNACYPKKLQKNTSTPMVKKTWKKRERDASGDFSLDVPIPKKRRQM